MAEQASLVWGMTDIDMEKYLYYGIMEDTSAGGPVQLEPDLEEQVQAEVERIRAENPELPTLGGR